MRIKEENISEHKGSPLTTPWKPPYLENPPLKRPIVGVEVLASEQKGR